MELKILLVFCGLAVSQTASTSENRDVETSNYLSKVDEVIDNAIDQFENQQHENMKAGFTSNAKRSYKKTK